MHFKRSTKWQTSNAPTFILFPRVLRDFSVGAYSKYAREFRLGLVSTPIAREGHCWRKLFAGWENKAARSPGTTKSSAASKWTGSTVRARGTHGKTNARKLYSRSSCLARNIEEKMCHTERWACYETWRLLTRVNHAAHRIPWRSRFAVSLPPTRDSRSALLPPPDTFPPLLPRTSLPTYSDPVVFLPAITLNPTQLN